MAFRLTPEGFESIPELIQLADRADPFLSARLKVAGPRWEGLAVVHLPFRMLEQVLGGSATTDTQVVTEEQVRASIESALVAAQVTVDVRFPAFPLPLGVLATLSEGTILRTRIPVDSNLDISICGQRRFIGQPGRLGQDLAVQILEPARDGS